MTMNAIEQLKKHEGFRDKPYFCTEGHLTIGYGLNLDAGVTEEEAEVILSMRVEGIRKRLANAIPWYANLAAPRQGVLVNMAYNLGVAGLMGFAKTLTHIRSGDYNTASHEMLDSRWARQVPTRAAELALQMQTGEWQ
ncbi:glycoside hydrolase family protein [Pseudoalteromonas sp. R3]|uniref:glycoside hydrolase family protein n=1 Tax=Pseudoalteromonas sp. R3 TaxID=1709477 RepID=UPI0006B4D3F9|nr:glycoside hydrolase family protein [Pseudoalteromonas sp. R3]AZZ98765.1 glycoside hydrolase [Pseudoalteromonas sp. R3]